MLRVAITAVYQCMQSSVYKRAENKQFEHIFVNNIKFLFLNAGFEHAEYADRRERLSC